MDRLQNKIVVITGASSGLGKEIAIQSAKAGAIVVLIARNYSKLNKVKNEIEKSCSSKVVSYVCDVSNGEQVEEVFSMISTEVGLVDVLVNNAGFGLFEEAEKLNLLESKRMFDVNVIGMIVCTKKAVPSMIKRKSGHIINIGSQAGKVATPKSSVYSATKHAVLGFSNSLRLELEEYNVYVTTVNPGPIATDFFENADPLGTYVKSVGKYMLKPEEVAREIVASMLVNKREINLPRWMNVGAVIYSVFPKTFEALGKRFFFKK